MSCRPKVQSADGLEKTKPREPNHALLEAMRLAEIQRGMNPAQARDTLALIREARAGAMYGEEVSDEPEGLNLS